MEELIQEYEKLPDIRQEVKVKHKLVDIVMITILATLANADEWEDIEIWGQENEEWLGNYLTLENGIPSHDTIQRNIAIIETDQINMIFLGWLEEKLKAKGIKIKKDLKEVTNEVEKVLAIDGKTACGSRNKYHKAVHILTAYMVANGISLAQISTDEKSNEITAIPELLDMIEIEGQIVTIDAMGAQKEIAKKIVKDKKADYVLGLKGNQKLFAKEVEEYFEEDVKKELENNNGSYEVKEKSHGMIIKYKSYSTEDIDWFTEKEKWEGLKSIALIEKTMINIDTGEITEERRHYISSLEANAESIYNITRNHWRIETSLHWHLDVSFREDSNKTIDRNLVKNMNVIRKIALNILKITEFDKKYSIKKKRYLISCNSKKYIPMAINNIGIIA